MVLLHREGDKCVGILLKVTIQLADLLLRIFLDGVVQADLLTGKCKLHGIAPFVVSPLGVSLL